MTTPPEGERLMPCPFCKWNRRVAPPAPPVEGALDVVVSELKRLASDAGPFARDAQQAYAHAASLVAGLRRFRDDVLAADHVAPAAAGGALYPCRCCGKLRTKDQGGTTFTVCDRCWDAKCTTDKPRCAKQKQTSTNNPALISRSHPEGTCEKCGGPNICWHTDNATWNQYARTKGHGILCPFCFAALVEDDRRSTIWFFGEAAPSAEREGLAERCEAEANFAANITVFQAGILRRAAAALRARPGEET